MELGSSTLLFSPPLGYSRILKTGNLKNNPKEGSCRSLWVRSIWHQPRLMETVIAILFPDQVSPWSFITCIRAAEAAKKLYLPLKIQLDPCISMFLPQCIQAEMQLCTHASASREFSNHFAQLLPQRISQHILKISMLSRSGYLGDTNAARCSTSKNNLQWPYSV